MNITDFLPQYREINALFTDIANKGNVSYFEQTVITDFYHTFKDIKAFEEMVLSLVVEKDSQTSLLLLSGIKSEIENNIRLYESAKELLESIDILKVCKWYASQYDYEVKLQLEVTNEQNRELRKVDGSLEAIAYREHTQKYEDELWREHERLTELYNIEKGKLASLYDAQRDSKREAMKYNENLFGKIYSLSLSLHSIIKCYIKDENKIDFVEEEKPKITPKPISEIEPDTIFRVKMFDKFLLLEQKLIKDSYLNADLQWLSTHDNGKIDIKRLVIFLTALVENRYFLPERDPKIKTFFEARYNVTIGQNFERKRREALLNEYKIVFHDYPF